MTENFKKCLKLIFKGGSTLLRRFYEINLLNFATRRHPSSHKFRNLKAAIWQYFNFLSFAVIVWFLLTFSLKVIATFQEKISTYIGIYFSQAVLVSQYD